MIRNPYIAEALVRIQREEVERSARRTAGRGRRRERRRRR
jgi:hypothetical protein